MKKGNNIDNTTNSKDFKTTVTSFANEYGTRKNIAVTIGVASLVGLAVYSAIKWVPFNSLFQSAKEEFTKVKGNFETSEV
ncbi:MAG TPA: hypothetical protein VF691_12980, partial [Cytophagaceae bacterium]